MDGSTAISAGGLTTLLVEGLKLVWRKFVVNDMTYDFPVLFYALGVPVSNALMPFVLQFLGFVSQDPILTMDLTSILKYVAVIAIASLISFVGYKDGLKPLKEYAKTV